MVYFKFGVGITIALALAYGNSQDWGMQNPYEKAQTQINEQTNGGKITAEFCNKSVGTDGQSHAYQELKKTICRAYQQGRKAGLALQ